MIYSDLVTANLKCPFFVLQFLHLCSDYPWNFQGKSFLSDKDANHFWSQN